MRSVVSRLARLERLNRLSTASQRLRIQYGYLTTLPDDYTGPRHVVTVKQLPSGPGGEDWFEWEERPGRQPASNATGCNDEIVVHVCYWRKCRPEAATTYSVRSVRIGSIEAARRAGTNPATSAQAARATTARPRITGSWLFTP